MGLIIKGCSVTPAWGDGNKVMTRVCGGEEGVTVVAYIYMCIPHASGTCALAAVRVCDWEGLGVNYVRVDL